MAEIGNKDIRYLNKDFQSFRQSLIDFTKIYYPNTYADFNESSIGMMFIEMAAYVGDVLSYYTDSNVKESLLQYAEERNNVVRLAQNIGYNYKTTSAASTFVDIYQLIPSTGIKGSEIDFRFAMNIEENAVIASESNPSIQFRIVESVDFSKVRTQNFTATKYQVDASGNVVLYLLKKTVPAIAGNIVELRVDVGAPEQFKKITLPYTDIIEVISITDSDGNKWHEVDYLAQDVIFVNDYFPSTYNEINGNDDRILKLKKVSDRYIVRKNLNKETVIQFGSGVSSFPDEVLIPSPDTVKYNNTFVPDKLSIDFMSTRTYGHVPYNTTLTISFTRGGGILSNASQGDLSVIKYLVTKNTTEDFSDVADKRIFAEMKNTIAVMNSTPATGGRGEETIEEIRQNSIASFFAQNRCVTENDYLVKTLSMPPKYGAVTKAYVKKGLDSFSIDIYTLGYDSNTNLCNLGDTTKLNLKTYLSNYRTLASSINIKNAFIINIGVQFEISCLPQYNKNDVLLRCIETVKDFFGIDKWQIGQSIVVMDIYSILNLIPGVRTVSSVNIINNFSSGGDITYSNNYYPIGAATINGIIYPSVDPSIFEVKYPNSDISGVVR